MNIYELKENAERFCRFTPVDPKDGMIYHHFNGTALNADWTEHQIRAADGPDHKALLPDFGLLGVVPIVSEEAVAVLGDMLEKNGELFPIRHARRRYFAFNVTGVLDALDEKQSVVELFSHGGLMRVERYVFRGDAVRGAMIFKIPQLPRAYVFVTDAIVERVRRAELLGFVFSRLWSDTVTTVE